VPLDAIRCAGRAASAAASTAALLTAALAAALAGCATGTAGRTAAAPAASTADSASPTDSPGPTDSPSTTDSPALSASPAAAVRGGEVSPLQAAEAAGTAALTGYLSGRGARIGVAVLDRVTGAAVGYQDGTAFHTASVVKMDILATLLWQDQRAGRQLTDDQRDLATSMITASDNDAATSLWDAIGSGSGLAAANRAFGLTHTTPGSDGSWGLTTTTAADQVRLLAVLADPDGPLSADSRAYELGLLSRVESDQRWGVPSAADATATAVYVKNGWLSYTGDNGWWIVNSVGRIVEPGHDWLVAILSDQNGDEDSGIDRIQRSATVTLDALRRN
jgi:beta-lactamase class A